MRSIIILSLTLFISACSILKRTSDSNDVELPELIIEDVQKTSEILDYKASETRENDLIHTKLEVTFDWEKEQLNGKAYLTFKPYFHPKKELVLDAKAFDIHDVKLMGKNIPLVYEYDGFFLTIQLDTTYTREQEYEVFVNYTAKPNEVTQQGSSAITSAQGLYFINSDSSEANKPTQLWTQGETEASSCWFPTIDAPNERTTQEIYITTKKEFTTLSNGILIYSTDNGDGTKTDYWKQDLPHAPYLFMMAVGNYVIVEDEWRDMNVYYYVEPEYKDHAKAIFGHTPEMMEAYSKMLGIDYPWEKYSQVIARDYVSGAMENTSATLHGEFVQKTTRELLDGDQDGIISHELFHQWFGDLVTCESWSNLPLNESFATYGEYLWREYKYGDDYADLIAQRQLRSYLNEASRGKRVDIIRFYYDNKEDMFDSHSYAKGGRVLHMLRNYLGDDAFFEGLRVYLEDNKYSAVEIHNLRLAFEKVSGEDLNWFFNQWFLNQGHPELEFTYEYDETTKIQTVTVEQKQNFAKAPLYQLPIAIDIYANGKKERHKVMVRKPKEAYKFNVDAKPNLVNVDADKILLCEKVDNKTNEEWIFQFYNAPKYLDRFEALSACAEMENAEGNQVIVDALNDPFWKIRSLAMEKLKPAVADHKEKIKTKLKTIATDDKKAKCRAEAFTQLARYYGSDDMIAFTEKGLQDSAYSVISSSIAGIASIDANKGLELAKEYEDTKITDAIASIYANHGTAEQNDFFNRKKDKITGESQFSFVTNYAKFLKRQDDQTINEALPYFEKAAKSGSPWWVKLSGYQALNAIANHYNIRASEAQSELDTLEKNNMEYNDSLLKTLNDAKASEQKILDSIAKLKSAEENKRILQYLNGSR